MKKFISVVLLLSLVLGLLAGCTPSAEPVKPASNLENAKSLVFNTYKPANKDQIPFKSVDFEVMTSVLVDGETFPVAWTVEVTEGPAEAVKIVDGSSEAFKKVDLTEKPEVDVKFTLTATISDAEGNTATVSFKYQTPKFEAPAADKVVIKFPKDNKYVTGTEEKYTSSSGTVKMELVLSDAKADAIAFTLIENADGTTSFKTDDGYYLLADGTNVQFVTEESDNTKFVLEVADGGYFIKCAYATFSGKAQYLEVYSGYLTCYGMGSDPSIYVFALEAADGANGKVVKYSEGGSTEPTTPSEPTTPTEPPVAKLPEISAPVPGTAYKFGVVQVTNGHTVYVNGEISTRYLATTTDKAAALDVYVEEADGGYKFYILVEGAKNYIYIYNNADGKRSVGYSATEANVFTYKADIATWATTFDGKECYVGSYNNFDTLSVSDLSYINASNAGVTQFPAGFFAADGSSAPVDPQPSEPTVTEPTVTEPTVTEPAVTEPEETKPAAPSTPAEIIDAAYALEKDTALDGTYSLTGKVIGIDSAYNSQYQNVSVVIVVEGREDKPMLCYRMKGTGADTVKVGDVITVTGAIKNYAGKVEFDANCTFVMVSVHTCTEYTKATCLAPATCVDCGLTVGEVGDHTYENGACTVCGTAEGVSLITATQTMKSLISANGWTDTTTKQTFKLDDNVTVKINGGSNTGKAYSGDHIRIYATDTPAGTITISVPEGYELVSVKISAQTGTYAFLYVDGTSTDICNETVNVSGQSVLLNSVKNGTNGKQVRVTAMEVIYKAV